MIHRSIFFACLVMALNYALIGQEKNQQRSYETQRVYGEAPIIDGYLDDIAWNQVEWGGDFIQRSPEEGAPPSQPTIFKILYDAKFLYVGIHAFDSSPEAVVRRMSRRDGFEGDFVEINIDSYADKRTAFSFSASASGVKGEEFISNNGSNWDSTWDPIWYLKTSLNDSGWVAEFKIPLSQLRFADQSEHTWGLQVMRMYFNNQERSYWQPIAQDAPGWVHLFGELRGIKGIKPQKQLEIQPYLLGKTEKYPKVEGNPYMSGSDSDLDFGVDAKIGLTSDITLDLSINPDFGQVEADPSRVNLSAFQLFFRERRPFFLEGNNTLNFSMTQSQAGGFFNNDNLFYSRRIGSRPHYYPDAQDINYVDRINNTRILGAAKLTGKNKNGFSWGILESVTRKEFIEVQDTLGDEREVAIEPLTNYAVGRVQQDINDGNALIGAMFTATNRVIDDPQFNGMHENAYSAGVDFTQNFFDRNYYLRANLAISNVNGSKEAIINTQRSSERYFQRPDNHHKTVDSTLTQLTGTGASLSVGKQNGDIIFQSGATMRSPEFETNDVGFLVQSDYVSHWAWAQYRKLKPFGIFRWIRVNINEYLTYDFDGVNLYNAFNLNAHARFKNLWGMGIGTTIEGESVSNADLRGGPSIRYPGSKSLWAYLGTNDQKKLYFEVNPWISGGSNDFLKGYGMSTFIRYQPTDALMLSFAPNIEWYRNALQYVDGFSDDFSDQYILGNIDHMTYSASVRVNYIITPNLSVEYWGQPFISRLQYDDFKKVLSPGESQYDKRYRSYHVDEISFNSNAGFYEIDNNMDGTAEYQMDNPNFNAIQFRSNFVIRWEYTPGSTLFLVWTSNADNSHNSTQNRFRDLSNDLFDKEAHNIFLVKYTYRFIL